MDIVDTLQRAIGILEKEMKKGGASMMQLKNAGSLVQALSVMMDSSMINTADATKLTAFVQNQQEDSDSGAPAAAVYENQSGGILEVLGDMLDKAETQLESARQTETKSLHAYEMVKQSLTDEIKFGNKEMGEAKAGTAAASEKKAGAEGDLEMTNKDLSEDIKAKSELHHECMTKATDFEAEVKSRGEELAALAKAKQIINEAMASALDQQSAGLDEATSFLQMSTGTSAQVQAVHLIRELAKKHHNPMLAQLAARIVSVGRGRTGAADVFAKVKDLVRDMVEKLEAEAEADATQKAFCDKELGETNTKKDQKETEIEKLQTKIDSDSARSAELKEQTAALENELSILASSQAEMDKMRSEEKAVFDESKAELEKGLAGIKQALKVLRDYYAKEDKAHSSSDGASSGIVGLLEVCESDFSKNLAEVISVEESAVASYETETKENEIQKTTKEQDVKYKTKESTQLDKAAAETSNDLEGVKAELSAVLEYLKKIEEKCIAKAETFEERQARFKAEIEGLKNALQILNEEAALVQTGSTRRSLRAVRKHQ